MPRMAILAAHAPSEIGKATSKSMANIDESRLIQPIDLDTLRERSNDKTCLRKSMIHSQSGQTKRVQASKQGDCGWWLAGAWYKSRTIDLKLIEERVSEHP